MFSYNKAHGTVIKTENQRFPNFSSDGPHTSMENTRGFGNTFQIIIIIILHYFLNYMYVFFKYKTKLISKIIYLFVCIIC